MKPAPSLTLRLTALFAVASTAVILALGYLIGAAVEQHFVEQDMEVLSGKLEQTRRLLEKASTGRDFESLPQQLDDALSGQRGLAIVILSPEGGTLFATRDAGFPHELLAQPETTGVPRLVAWKTAQDRPFRGIASRTTLFGGGDALEVLLGAVLDVRVRRFAAKVLDAPLSVVPGRIDDGRNGHVSIARTEIELVAALGLVDDILSHSKPP